MESQMGSSHTGILGQRTVVAKGSIFGVHKCNNEAECQAAVKGLL